MVTGFMRVVGAAGCAVLTLGLFNVAPASAASSSVSAVGSNADGQLRSDSIPTGLVTKSTLSGVKAIAAGFEDSMVLLDNGTVVTWGSNMYGQLGNGTTNDANVPVLVCAATVTSCPPGSPASSYLHGVTAIAAGAFFNVALVGGTLMEWGRAGNGSQGSLGVGTTRGNTCNGECQTIPLQVCAVGVTSCPAGSPPSSFLQGVTAFAAGTYFTLAVLNKSTVVSWGSNTSGQLGNGGVSDSTLEPVQVCAVKVKSCPPGSKPSLFLSGVTEVSGGDSFSMALKGHTALAWGENRYGQLGDGTTAGPDRCGPFACSKAPLAVSLKMPVSAVSATNYHSLAMVDSRSGKPVGIEAWGSNTEGQVGLKPMHGNACHGGCQTTRRGAQPLDGADRHLGRPFLQFGARRGQGPWLGRQSRTRTPRKRHPHQHQRAGRGLCGRGQVVSAGFEVPLIPPRGLGRLGWRDCESGPRERDSRRVGIQLSRLARHRYVRAGRQCLPSPGERARRDVRQNQQALTSGCATPPGPSHRSEIRESIPLTEPDGTDIVADVRPGPTQHPAGPQRWRPDARPQRYGAPQRKLRVWIGI